MVISCPSCKTSFNLRDDKVPAAGGKLRCFKCKTVFSFDAVKKDNGGGRLVLVANESKAFCQTVSDLLEENGIRADVAYDGEEALSKIRKLRPNVALLDVALPKMFGFDVCETVKNDHILKETKVVLIAAIYDKTQYKRNPSSLYGADDYIEKHHIHDRLVDMIWELTPGADSNSSGKDEKTAHETVIPSETEKEISDSAEEELKYEDNAGHDDASRLARIIVSDIALYNEKLVIEGIRNNNFFELLKDDIAEGRKLFMQRVPKEIWEKRDYLKESLDEFIVKHQALN